MPVGVIGDSTGSVVCWNPHEPGRASHAYGPLPTADLFPLVSVNRFALWEMPAFVYSRNG